MDFLIRDDDTSFLTHPEELEEAWGWYLERDYGRLNLAVIPFVDPSRFGVAGSERMPIGKNEKLTSYLKRKISENKIEILLHGYSHASRGARFEFEGADRETLSSEIREGMEHLERVFGVKVKVFVPPNNAISKEGLDAVRENGLNILASFPASPLRAGIRHGAMAHFLKRAIFSLRYKKHFKGKYIYPFPVRLEGWSHLDCLGFIPGRFSQDDLIGIYSLIKKLEGTFCLATHYSEIDKICCPAIKGLVDRIAKDRDSRFVLASDILGGKR